MLRQNKTRPGVVALYDIWPGNGAGLFLQPRSPYGARGYRSFPDDNVCDTSLLFFLQRALSIQNHN